MTRAHKGLVLAGLLACNPSIEDTTGFTTPGTTTPGVTTPPGDTSESRGSAGGSSTGSSSSGAEESSVGGSSSGGTVWDMGPPVDFGSQHPVGCRGKIDFLFVISTAGTMEETQKQLAVSFPGFLASIEEHFDDFDVHILSAKPNKSWSMVDCAFCSDPACDLNATPPECGVELHLCDETVGAGVTFPAGEGSANRPCNFFGGHRYITGDDPDFEESFACATQAGMNGGIATSAEAMVEAISPKFNGSGGCNEGFLRDDALLVVTILDDGYDDFSKGTVESWIAALREAKHGDEDAFAVLVLTTDIDVGFWQLCHPDIYSMVKNPLRLLVEGVEHGFIGSICEETYAPFFNETVAEVVALCDGFIIPQ